MATNLRLRADTAAAVKSEAERTGRSQQDVMRDAIESYLVSGTTAPAPSRPASSLDLVPPRTPLRRATMRIRLAAGNSSADLLGREDRL